MDRMNFHLSYSPSKKTNKKESYQLLVKERKLCSACNGVANPSKIMNGVFDNEDQCIGPWSKLKGDLNAKVMVIGQDWGNEEYYIHQQGKPNPDNFTNKRLKDLLEIAGFDFDTTPMFFTNAILCMKKTKGLGGSVKTSWFRNCFDFLVKQIKIVNPDVLITLGSKPFEALKPLYTNGCPSFKDAVNQREPIFLDMNGSIIKHFPVYHCGKNGFRNRSKQDQINDWKRIRDYLIHC
ncbi:uracil-DNA glycosylase family protein [Thermaerobacillus caldiproteolyticus]|uniref:DNA polymerase n=1 Tax=Thermaerobacillus caldiproteolyticus TaxID=247480 RepID=A0A7V9Z8X3_9BACL|nr:uracil-DNA glycosylase family protein [Anoxybacillus caldiproteolyticus]MBA2876243.1 DNA polymerase [Anoxybacillus caldiproteolyticus]